jgi:hypothetical protein
MQIFEDLIAYTIAPLLIVGIWFAFFIKKSYNTAYILFGVLFLASLWLFPAFINIPLLDLYLNIPTIVFLVIFVCLGFLAYKFVEKEKYVKAFLAAILAIGIPYLLDISFDTYRLSAIAHAYQPKVISELPVFDQNSLVHTTKEVAITAMQGGNSNSLFKPKLEYLDRTVDDKGVIYIAPNTPGDWVNIYAANPGYTLLRDYIKDGNYVEEIQQEQPYGESLYWTHDIVHKIYFGTFFGNFSKITPVPVNTESGTKILMVADKIGYDWYSNTPEWLGMMVSDGKTFEFLNPEQAKKDPRFTNRIIFPREIALRMIESQVANTGFWNALLPRTDRIDHKNIDDNLQEVLLTQADGSKHPYYFVPVQPENGKALLSAYLVDAHDGSFSVYNYPHLPSQIGHNQGVLSVEAGSSVIPWSDDNYKVGMIQYYNGAQGPYWIGSIVKKTVDPDDSKNKQQIFVEDVAVSALQTDQKLKFSSRASLETWMSTGQITNTVSVSDLNQQLQDLRQKEDEILKELIKS